MIQCSKPPAAGTDGSLLVLATYDSFLKSALPVAAALGASGFAARIVLAEARSGQISARQLDSMGLERDVEVRRLDRLTEDPALYRESVILLAMDGKRTAEFLWRFRTGLPAAARRRPITIAGYPGVVFRSHVHGLANRFGCDIVLLNSPADHADYLEVCARFGLEPVNGLCLGLSVLAEAPRPRPAASPPAALLYCEQPDVPRLKVERLYIIDRLIGYARRHPDRRVLIKPRHTPAEITLKRTEHHLEPIIERVRRAGALPRNLELTYRAVEQLLEEVDLCVTVSSTAALQAAALGVPFAILADFGIREDYGTHFYMGSGCIRTFDELDADRLPALEPVWAARHVRSGRAHMGLLLDRVRELLDRQAADGAPLPFVPPGFGAECEALFRYKFAAQPDRQAGLGSQPARATQDAGPGPLLRKIRKLVRSPRRFTADLVEKRRHGRCFPRVPASVR